VVLWLRSSSSTIFCLCFVLLIFLLPLISTLFPYTTLFRSNVVVCAVADPTLATPQCSYGPFKGWIVFQDSGPTPWQFDNGEPILDRKSTRLNSSHQIISYAVFCLKKKKKKISQ